MPQPFHVYMLKCSDGSYYVGHTDDLQRRAATHEAGAIPGYTSVRLPVRLVWSQEFASRVEAMESEGKIKKWSRAKKRALAEGDYPGLQVLAKKADWHAHRERIDIRRRTRETGPTQPIHPKSRPHSTHSC